MSVSEINNDFYNLSLGKSIESIDNTNQQTLANLEFSLSKAEDLLYQLEITTPVGIRSIEDPLLAVSIGIKEMVDFLLDVLQKQNNELSRTKTEEEIQYLLNLHLQSCFKYGL